MDKRAQVKAALAAATAKTPNPNPLATTTAPEPVAPPEPAPVALSPEAADAAQKERERLAKRALNAWRAKGKNSIRPTSVGLRYAEIEELDQIAKAAGVKRNAIMAWALRQFLADQRAGKVRVADHLKTETKPVLVVASKR